MGRTIKARVANARQEPLEPLGMREGEEVTLTIVSVPSGTEPDGFERAAGAWKGTIDAEALIRNIYEDRLIRTRSEPKLCALPTSSTRIGHLQNLRPQARESAPAEKARRRS